MKMKVKVKGKVFPLHAAKAYRRSSRIALLFLDISTRQWRVIICMPLTAHPW